MIGQELQLASPTVSKYSLRVEIAATGPVYLFLKSAIYESFPITFFLVLWCCPSQGRHIATSACICFCERVEVNFIESDDMLITRNSTATRNAEAARSYTAITIDSPLVARFKSAGNDNLDTGKPFGMAARNCLPHDSSTPVLTRYAFNVSSDFDKAPDASQQVVLEMEAQPDRPAVRRESGYYGGIDSGSDSGIDSGIDSESDSGADSGYASIDLGLGHYLATGEFPPPNRMKKDSDVFVMIESLRTEDAHSLASASSTSASSFQHYLSDPLKQVFANEHADPAMRRLSNVVNVILRTIATNGITGFSKGWLTSEIERALVAGSVGVTGRTALGVAAPMLPLAIGCAVAYRNIRNGDATFSSANQVAKLALALVSMAGVAMAATSGAVPAMAAGLTAAVITDAMQQVIQNYLVVSSEGPPEKNGALITSSFTSGVVALGTAYINDSLDVAVLPGTWSGGNAAVKMLTSTALASGNIFTSEKVKQYFADRDVRDSEPVPSTISSRFAMLTHASGQSPENRQIGRGCVESTEMQSEMQSEIRFKLEVKNPGVKELWESSHTAFSSRATMNTGVGMVAAAVRQLVTNSYGPIWAGTAEKAAGAITRGLLYAPLAKALAGKNGGDYSLGGEVVPTLPGAGALAGRSSRRLSSVSD